MQPLHPQKNNTPMQRHLFRTSDGISLSYFKKGNGQIVIFLPGWSQTAAMFEPQILDLSQNYSVFALDMRGHGESEKPAHGYRIARFAKDLWEFLEALNLRDVTLAGHSMGCAIIWSYLDLFGSQRVSRLILIDQGAALLKWPHRSESEMHQGGSRLDASSLMSFVANLAGEHGERETASYIYDSFFTETIPKATADWVLSENLKFPRQHAARLLLDLYAQDWRDVICRITLPTLVMAGESSIFSPLSQRWIADQIPNAQYEYFLSSEGGSHFMWLENPAKFNEIVRTFINRCSSAQGKNGARELRDS